MDIATIVRELENTTAVFRISQVGWRQENHQAGAERTAPAFLVFGSAPMLETSLTRFADHLSSVHGAVTAQAVLERLSMDPSGVLRLSA